MSQKDVKKIKSDKIKTKKHGDILAKVLSVVAAVILWFYVVDTETTLVDKKIYGIPVITSLDDSTGLCLVSGTDNVVEIEVEGNASDIQDLTEDDIKAYVDLSDVKSEGVFTEKIKFKVPDGITVKKRTPDSVSVVVEKSVDKVVPLKVVLENYSIDEDNYQLGSVTPAFDKITVSGPENDVEIVSGGLINLDLNGELKGNKLVKGKIVLVDIDGKTINSPYLEQSETSVEVKISVKAVKKDTSDIKEADKE